MKHFFTSLIKLHWVPLPAPGPPSTNITFGRVIERECVAYKYKNNLLVVNGDRSFYHYIERKNFNQNNTVTCFDNKQHQWWVY
ncbi:hypothetical protein DERP_011407 [Dermatophagoides pteronyssinus]|uniref:Uncharacterized protein n=1 Tax=Dermatophagoides pteronyssinus TaxID=6956 RepID=A0ABQ8J589_DERPT|nr:hypothetical protein DERP_011407 [Dermatophagoides pteronyssinus]